MTPREEIARWLQEEAPNLHGQYDLDLLNDFYVRRAKQGAAMVRNFLENTCCSPCLTLMNEARKETH